MHDKGSYIFCQLWALGRAAYIEHLAMENPNYPYVSASDVQQKAKAKAPRPLTIDGKNISIDRFVLQDDTNGQNEFL